MAAIGQDFHKKNCDALIGCESCPRGWHPRTPYDYQLQTHKHSAYCMSQTPQATGVWFWVGNHPEQLQPIMTSQYKHLLFNVVINITLCVFSVFLAFVGVFISLLFIPFVTVHCKTNFLVNFTGTIKILILIQCTFCVKIPKIGGVLFASRVKA